MTKPYVRCFFEIRHDELISSVMTQFARYLPAIYPLATELLSRDASPDIRDGLKEYFLRVGYAQGIIEPS